VNDTNTKAEDHPAQNGQAKPGPGEPSPVESTQRESGQGTPARDERGNSGFDWVSERSSCSLPKVFNVLRLQVEADVKTRNALRLNYSPYEFFLAEDTGEFKVLLKAKELQQTVTFSLGERAIQVRDGQDNKMFEVTVAFDEKGKCRLNVNGEERDFWQVRRMALEDLMFRGL
jgi:hypothetical protein